VAADTVDELVFVLTPARRMCSRSDVLDSSTYRWIAHMSSCDAVSVELVPLPPAVSEVDFAILPDGTGLTVAVTVALLGYPFKALELAALDPDAGASGAFDRVLTAALDVAGDALAGEVFSRAVVAASTVTDGFERTRVMFRIASVMAARTPTDRDATARAVELASSTPIPDDLPEWMYRVLNRDYAMAEIAEALAEAAPSNPEVVAAATALVEGLGHVAGRQLTHLHIALSVARADPTNREATDRALELDQKLSYRREIAVLTARSDPSDPAVVAWAVELAQAARGWESGWAQADIAECVAASRPDDKETVNRALAIAESISDPGDRAVGLAQISDAIREARPEQAASLSDKALRAARAIDDEDDRSAALADIAERVAQRDPTESETISWALEIAHAIPQEGDRMTTVIRIAEMHCAADPSNPYALEHALALVSPFVDKLTLAGIALRTASDLSGDPVRSEALINTAVGLVMDEADDRTRCRDLAELAQRLALTEPSRASELLGAALELAKTLPPTPSETTDPGTRHIRIANF
jgi:hypothetical protein